MVEKTQIALARAIRTSKGTGFHIISVGEADHDGSCIIVHFENDIPERLFMIDTLVDIGGGVIIPFTHKVSEMTKDEINLFVIGNSVEKLHKVFGENGDIDFSGVELVVSESSRGLKPEQRPIERIIKGGHIFLGMEDYSVRNELYADKEDIERFLDEINDYVPKLTKIDEGYYVEVV
jgi:hypothetical protein